MNDSHPQFDSALTRGAPLFSLLMVGLVAAAPFDVKPTNSVAIAKLSTADCESWDRDAVEGLIP